MKHNISDIKKELKKLDKNIKEVEDDLLDPHHVSSKLTELEDRSRRNNLRIDRIQERPNETWEDCEASVQVMLKEKLGITDNTEFERCHRMSKRSNPNRPRTIICKATKFKKILKNAKFLKDKGIYTYEDLCKDIMELRKKLWNQVLEYRKQNKFAYLNYRSIVVREHGRDRAVR